MNEKLIVIIPAYEPPKEFVDYAKQVSQIAKRIVVINDGSNDSYNEIFDPIAAIENVDYIRLEKNKGKGFGLKTAFAHCKEFADGDDVIVTADCDGQHKIEDILKVYRSYLEHPGSLMLGSRDFTQKNVPPRSRFGNVFTSKLFHLLYGLNIYDTQTGLRAMSVDMAERFISIRGDRFEYEMNMLIYAQKNGIPVSEAPIETVYPDDPADHVSHFNPIKDSIRILGVVLKNLNWYLISSVLSGLLDILVFFVLTTYIFEISALNTLIATVTARVASSILNFHFNRKYVFAGKSKRSIIRYYLLWLFQLGASYGLVFLFGNIMGLNLTIMKGLGDILLGILSYQIQRLWVFKNDNSREFYGPFITIAKQLAMAFGKKYRINVIPHDDKGVVYVCRHLNMHGPITTLRWFKFNVHPMIYHPFFKERDCYIQYRDYTFSVREGKKAGKFNLKAWLASRIVPAGVRSIKAIPVYRGESASASINTFRHSMDCLIKNESIIVYADIEYTADKDHMSEIYTGFLFLGEMYKRRTGKSLRFIPLYIDDEKRTVTELAPVTADVFKSDSEAAAEYLKLAINGKVTSPDELKLEA